MILLSSNNNFCSVPQNFQGGRAIITIQAALPKNTLGEKLLAILMVVLQQCLYTPHAEPIPLRSSRAIKLPSCHIAHYWLDAAVWPPLRLH